MGTIFSQPSNHNTGTPMCKRWSRRGSLDEKVLKYCLVVQQDWIFEIRTVLESPALWGPMPWPWCPSKSPPSEMSSPELSSLIIYLFSLMRHWDKLHTILQSLSMLTVKCKFLLCCWCSMIKNFKKFLALVVWINYKMPLLALPLFSSIACELCCLWNTCHYCWNII